MAKRPKSFYLNTSLLLFVLAYPMFYIGGRDANPGVLLIAYALAAVASLLSMFFS